MGLRSDEMIHATLAPEQIDNAVERLQERRRQLHDWMTTEVTSREGAHEWKAEVLKGRLQEVEWALELLGHTPGAPATGQTRSS
jgi:hypothetical protein